MLGEKRYDFKVVKSGDEIEIYKYQFSQWKSTPKEKEVKKTEKTSAEEKKEKQADVLDKNYRRSLRNIKKVKQDLRRLVSANVFQYKEKDKFITLTFEGKESPTREYLIETFDLFRRRLKDRYPDFEYIAIIERGKHNTKRLHFHTFFFNLPYVPQKEMMKIWKNGGVNIQALNSFYDVASYVVKYIEKTLEDGSLIPKGKKFYFTSRGLKRPQEYHLTQEELDEYLEENMLDKEIVYDVDFESEHMGKGNYKKFAKARDYVPKTPTFTNDDELYYYIQMMEELESNQIHE